MTTCVRCQLIVDGQHQHCPLCFKPLSNPSHSVTAYPTYEEFYHHPKGFTRFRLLLFLTIIAIVLSITINLLTLDINPHLWSFILTVGLLYAWVSIKDTLLSAAHVGKKILVNYSALSIFLFVIDVFVGFTGWSTNYAIPLFGIAATFLMTAIAIRQKTLWRDDMGYLLAMFFVNLSPMLLFVFKLSTVIWTSIAAIVYSLLTIIGMMIFTQRKFRNELEKRFHF